MEVIIELPKNVIMGSARGMLSVVGKLKKKRVCSSNAHCDILHRFHIYSFIRYQ